MPNNYTTSTYTESFQGGVNLPFAGHTRIVTITPNTGYAIDIADFNIGGALSEAQALGSGGYAYRYTNGVGGVVMPPEVDYVQFAWHDPPANSILEAQVWLHTPATSSTPANFNNNALIEIDIDGIATPASTWTFTLRDSNSTPINYTVTEHTETGITPGTLVHPIGTGSSYGPNGNWSSNELIITPAVGYTVQASDFSISNGNTSSGTGLVGGVATSPPSIWLYDDDHWSGAGGGVSVGTGPYISRVVFMDRENIPNDPSWSVGPTNTVVVQCEVKADDGGPIHMPNNDLIAEIDITGMARGIGSNNFQIEIKDIGDRDPIANI